tara:strand:- start:122 stop:673 length:552 start_codon:yes stop_codon:yes gene_type:complete
MLKILIIFVILNFYYPVLSSTKKELISQIQITDNLSFNFIQTVNDKSENGQCIIEYPKKIYCEYISPNKKIIVSNGRTLLIKTLNNNYYLYPLNKTPLEYLLDKEYLISKIKILEPRNIDNKYINFKFLENNNEINIFFDKKNLNLVGWHVQDMYQKLSVTFISAIKINQKINKKKFILPENN